MKTFVPVPFRRPSRVLSAARCESRLLPRASNAFARLGIRYEKNVHKALSVVAKRQGAALEYQPWFAFEDENGQGQIVPDWLLHFGDQTVVLDAKLTWTPEGSEKMRWLYLPVLERALKTRLRSALICRNLTPATSLIVESLRDTMRDHAQVPALQWLGRGPIAW